MSKGYSRCEICHVSIGEVHEDECPSSWVVHYARWAARIKSAQDRDAARTDGRSCITVTSERAEDDEHRVYWDVTVSTPWIVTSGPVVDAKDADEARRFALTDALNSLNESDET